MPHPSARDCASVSTLLEWYRKNKVGWNSACETDFLATRQSTGGRISVECSTPDFVFAKLVETMTNFPVDFSKVKPPALAIFADHQLDALPGKLDRISRSKASLFIREMSELQREQVRRFKESVRNAQVVEMSDTDHWCVTQRPAEIDREICAYLKANVR